MAEVPEVPGMQDGGTEDESPSTCSSSINLFQLDVWQRRELSETQRCILDVIAYGVTTDEAATEAATQLDAWCPPLDQDPDARNYIWAICDLVMYIVESHEVTPDIQEGVIRILRALQQIPKGTVNVFGACCTVSCLHRPRVGVN